MSRAYKKDYGSARIAQQREEKLLLKEYKLALKIRREDVNFIFSRSELFRCLFADIDELIQILDELTKWVDCKLKQEILNKTKERLAILRDLINHWLKQSATIH